MKTVKFRPALAKLVANGEKTTTWRLFDDKGIQVGDDLELMNWETHEVFGHAVATAVNEKMIKDLDGSDWEGHERFPDEATMYEKYREYYPGRNVGPETIVKTIHFKVLK